MQILVHNSSTGEALSPGEYNKSFLSYNIDFRPKYCVLKSKHRELFHIVIYIVSSIHSIHWTTALIRLIIRNNNENKTSTCECPSAMLFLILKNILNERTIGYIIKQEPCFTRILRNCMIRIYIFLECFKPYI